MYEKGIIVLTLYKLMEYFRFGVLEIFNYISLVPLMQVGNAFAKIK